MERGIIMPRGPGRRPPVPPGPPLPRAASVWRKYTIKEGKATSSNIVLISPYEKMARLARQVKEEEKEDFLIYTGDLSIGVAEAKKAEEQGSSVVISRGGTALKIKKAMPDIPVVEIKVTGFDLARALHKAKKFSKRVGVVGFYNIIFGVESLAEILDLSLEKIIITREDEVEAKIKRHGDLPIIIGDAVSIRIAESLGIRGILIESGKEAIIKAVHEAKNIAEIRRMEKIRAGNLQAILNSTYEGIIAVDKESRIHVFNRRAESIFGIKAQEVVGKRVEEAIPNTRLHRILQTGEEEFGCLQEIQDKKIATNRVPTIVDGEIVGAVATFQELESLQQSEQKIRRELHDRGHVAKTKIEDIIGRSPAIIEAKDKAIKMSQVDSTVIITGESGTGKELFAQALHNASFRHNGPFVAINCATLPENLLESELFGYVSGAFTGARPGGKTGLFEKAHKGTIFLDEIGEIPPAVQVRLLRVIEEKEVRKIGSDRIFPVDVRIIAATNLNLNELVERGEFREDLYYRLNILDLKLPPLRERREDIPLLVDHFVEHFNRKYRMAKNFSEDAKQRLKDLPWPGNVRGLKNFVEKAMVLSSRRLITGDIIRSLLQKETLEISPDQKYIFSLKLTGNFKEVERQLIDQLLEKLGEQKKVADLLGISRATIWRRSRGV